MIKPRVCCVAGARPNFVKIAALLREFRRRRVFETILLHTGQHVSPEMSGTIFEELDIPAPDISLGVQPATGRLQDSGIMERLAPAFAELGPDLVLVVGDVTSTAAAAVSAANLGIPVAHVEAGLRSFDRDMPEELNRVITDTLSSYLFVTEPSGVRNLRQEGIAERRIYLVGNVLIDTLLRCREPARRSRILEQLELQPGGYAVVTLHRPSNVDRAETLRCLAGVLSDLSHSLPVVFPVHPRTQRRLSECGIRSAGVRAIQPLGYLDFVHLMSEARLVLTDSGGVQEETTVLGVPCLTLRENTERPVTIDCGTNRLVGVEPGAILAAAREALRNPPRGGQTPALWDGNASARIADVLETALTGAGGNHSRNGGLEP